GSQKIKFMHFRQSIGQEFLGRIELTASNHIGLNIPTHLLGGLDTAGKAVGIHGVCGTGHGGSPLGMSLIEVPPCVQRGGFLPMKIAPSLQEVVRMWSGLSYFLVSRDTIRQHMVSARWSDRRVPVYMEKSEHSLDRSCRWHLAMREYFDATGGGCTTC